jgi:hypothetical protein
MILLPVPRPASVSSEAKESGVVLAFVTESP